jgi:hypothetical protein
LGLTVRGAPAALLSTAAAVVDQQDGTGLRRRHHAEHGHNRTIEVCPFHKANVSFPWDTGSLAVSTCG